MIDIHWFRLDPPKVKIWHKKSRKQTVCAWAARARAHQVGHAAGRIALPFAAVGCYGLGTARIDAGFSSVAKVF